MAHVSVQKPDTDAINTAKAKGKIEMASGAQAVRYNSRHDVIVLTMQSGAVAAIPRLLIPVVKDAAPTEIADVELSPMGTSLRFPLLDADFSVHGLIRHVFDVNEANRRAGSTKSPARAIASRENGRKGGRPRNDRAAV